MKILIIRLSSIGDILLTFPLINLLKEKFHHVEIDYLIKTEYEKVLDLYPEHINRIIFNSDSGFKGLRGIKRKVKEVYHLLNSAL